MRCMAMSEWISGKNSNAYAYRTRNTKTMNSKLYNVDSMSDLVSESNGELVQGGLCKLTNMQIDPLKY